MKGKAKGLGLASRYKEGSFPDAIVRNAFLYPDREAYVYGDQRLTFKQYNSRVNSLTRALMDRGLKKGDVLGVMAWNCLDYMDVFGAAEKGGFIITPLNVRLSPEELEYVINDSEACGLFVGEDFGNLAAALRPKLPRVKHYIAFDNGLPDMEHHARLLESYPDDEPDVDIGEDDPFLICYTSGTTGRPRGALYTQQRLLNTVIFHLLGVPITIYGRAALLAPLFHIAGVKAPFYVFYAGATTVIMKSFDAGNLLKTIETEKITDIALVPTSIVALLDHPDFEKYDLRSIRRLAYVGSPMPVELLRRCVKTFGPILAGTYGATESGPDVTRFAEQDHDVLDKPELRHRLLSCGHPVNGVHVRIVDEDGRDLPPGEIGEIIVKSNHLMNCYWKNPEATQKKIIDGWLHMGDLGRYDEDGYIYIVDRKEDMIISGGENIYPRDVEEVLYQHPAVRECGVIGIPDAKWVEKVHAVVAFKEGCSAAAEELIQFCRERMARYKAPKSIEIVHELPKNAAGKILRRMLKAKYVPEK